MSEIEDLRHQVARLQAVHDISTLMAEYARRCDLRENIDAIGELFAEDAVYETQGHLAESPPVVGRAAIVDLFKGLPDLLSFTAHFLANPNVQVGPDGDTARGQWHTLEFATTSTDPSEQLVMVAWYDNDFVRVGSRWVFKRIRFRDTGVFPYSEGWAKVRYVSLSTLERVPH